MNTSEIAERLYRAVSADPGLAKAIEDAGLSISLVNSKGEAVFDDKRDREPNDMDVFNVLTSQSFLNGASRFVNLVDRLASRDESPSYPPDVRLGPYTRRRK